MVRFTISKALFDHFPALHVGIAIIRGFDNSTVNPSTVMKLRKQEENIRESIKKESLSSLPGIRVWREAYSWFGAKPKKYRSSVEALHQRALEGDKIPSINPIVDVYNYLSLRHMLPFGADDLGKVESDISLTFAKGDEEFRAINSDEVKNPAQGEVVYSSGNSILCRRWNYRESEKTKIDNRTTDCVIYAESLLSDDASLKAALAEIEKILPCRTFVLDKKNNAIDLDAGMIFHADYSEFYPKATPDLKKSDEHEKSEKPKSASREHSEAPENNSFDDLLRTESMHWADQMARKIIRTRGQKDRYVCASG